MITSAHLESSATARATLASCSSPGADLHVMSRRAESPSSSRQPRMIFSSSVDAADHERGFAVAGGWSPRCYACSFCGREFNSAQALGGHMNIHRRDRARLRTSTSLTSLPHQADLTPIPQNTPQSARRSHYHPFETPFRDNPTAISTSIDTYPPPTIISAAPPFRLLDCMRPAAEPAMLPHPSRDENSPAAPVLLDPGPFRSSATRFSEIQNEAFSLSPNIAPHAAPLLIRPDSSIKPVQALSICAGQQASTRQARLDYSGAAAGGAQLIQFSQSIGRNKRARGNALDAVTISSEVKSTVQRRCDEQSSTSSEKANSYSLHAVAAAPPAPDIKELICLDLELRLGQSDSRASTTVSTCCAVRTTTARRLLPP